MFFVSRSNLFYFYFTTLQLVLVPCGGSKTSPRTIAQIIFHFLWGHLAYDGNFENGVLLMCALEGVSSVANVTSAYEESQ